jgi:hypothetical protein
MKVKKIAVVLVALFVIISACKKTNSFSGAKVYQLNNFSPVGGGYSETFTYNASGDVATMVKNNGIKQSVYYQGDTVTVATLNGLGQTTSAIEYILNGSGYAITWQGEFVDRNNSGGFAYDGNGMLTQATTYANHTLANTDNYTNNSAKNAVEIQHVNVANGTTYDYFTFLTSNNNTIGVQDFGQYYLGVSSSNLISTDVQINQAGDTTDIISYRYRYNGSAYVDTMVSYHRNGLLADSITYTYY